MFGDTDLAFTNLLKPIWKSLLIDMLAGGIGDYGIIIEFRFILD